MATRKICLYSVLAVVFLNAALSRAEMIAPLKTGRIVKISGEMIFIDAGVNEGVQPGDRFDILQRLTDGSVEISGMLSVMQVFEKSALCATGMLLPGRIPNVNDMLIERREIPYVTAPALRAGRPVIRSKEIRASEDNLNLVVGAEIETGAGIHRAYCVYRSLANSEWHGMALTRLDENDPYYWGMVPGFELKEGVIEYYIIAVDAEDRIAYSGSQENPHKALVQLAEPYYAEQADPGLVPGARELRGGKFPWILIPGVAQLRNGQTLKGLSLLGLESAALATGVAAGSEKAIYYGAAGLVYVFNLADVLLSE